jgi:hypothetical protein
MEEAPAFRRSGRGAVPGSSDHREGRRVSQAPGARPTDGAYNEGMSGWRKDRQEMGGEGAPAAGGERQAAVDGEEKQRACGECV